MCRAGLLLLAAAQLLQASLGPPSPDDDGGAALRFSPPRLALGARPLGQPHSERVDVVNGSNRTVRLSSITASTVHFHTSFFERRQVPPSGNTSFEVVFLAREEGDLDADLLIRTSEGVHKYAMSATGVASAYRLPALVRLAPPRDAACAATVHVHNPHDRPLQITEVYSSGGGAALELPGGGAEGPQTLWRLPPHATRPVVAVVARSSRDSRVSFVRIKLEGTPDGSSSLVVAVEIAAQEEPGPYAAPHSVDFGLGGTLDPPASVRLSMGNSSPRPLRVSSVTARARDGSPASCLRVVEVAASLPPHSPPDVDVATLTLDWKRAYDEGACCGKIVIETEPAERRIELPFTSRPLRGGLLPQRATVAAYLSSDPEIGAVRRVSLKNEFDVAVHVSDLVVGEGMDEYFEITDFRPMHFEKSSVGPCFDIRLKNWTRSLRFESKITLITNISAQIIPVHVYNGKLDLLMSIPPRPSDASVDATLDLGLVLASSVTGAALFLRNPNPAPVCLQGAGSYVSGVTIRLKGCSLRVPESYDADADIETCMCIPPDWHAVYIVSAVAPAVPSSVSGELWVATAHERLVVPVALTAAEGGRLTQPEAAGFGDCFPGTLCTLPLKIESSFLVDMDVVSVEAIPSDRRVYYVKRADGFPPTIAASKLNEIGWLHYDPYLHCEGKCYTGLDLNSTVGSQWLSLIMLPRNTLELDAALVRSRYFTYTNLTAATSFANISIRVDTTQVRNHILPASVSFVWPKLYAGPSTVTAPVSQAGRPSIFFVNLTNPSKIRSVLVQLVFDQTIGGEDDEWRAIPEGLHPPDLFNEERMSERAFFFSRTNETECEDGDDFGSSDVDWLPERLRPHPDTYLFDLPPGGARNVSITFLTRYPRRASSVLYIRNNLTIVETLRLTGRGAVASLKFGNRKPGSDTPLLFDMTEKHLKDCEKDKAKKSTSPPNFTVKRTLVARNTGAIPVRVSRFFVNGLECEGYGFRVLDCEPFELPPNGTRKVDVAFTPDFTLTKVRRLLVLETSLSDLVNFTLVASVPVSSTAKCAAALKRPSWESGLSGVALSLLAFVCACVAVAGVYESYKILGAMTASLLKEPCRDALPPFDLRAIGQMGLSKKSEAWKCCSLKESSSGKLNDWHDSACKAEVRAYPLVEDKQKCEETVASNNISGKKKKTIKKHDQSESSGAKKVAKSDPARKISISRSSIESTSKCVSESNSSDSGEAHKAPASNQICDRNKREGSEKKVHDDDSKRDPKHSKSKCDSVSSQSCEEDASSVSAESSNNDDAEGSKRKSDVEATSVKSPAIGDDKSKRPQCKYANYEGDGEDEEYDRKSQSSRSSSRNDAGRKRRESKEASKSNADKTPDRFECPDLNAIKQSKKENQKNNPKREKQVASKKRSLDKNSTFAGKNDTNRSSSPFNAARSSPTVPPIAVWENRASFSDVVARSDGSPSACPSARKEHQENKRTDPKAPAQSNRSKLKTEEPRKSDANHHSDLGPIGSNCYSKRSSTWSDNRPITRYGLQSLRERSDGAPQTSDSNLSNGYFYYPDSNYKSQLNPIGCPNRLQYAPAGGSILRNSPDLNRYRVPDEFASVDDPDCRKNPWNRTTDAPADLDYGQRNFYDSDAFTNLWNSPPNASQSTTADPRHQNRSNSTTSSDRGAAEWLWGYNNSNDGSAATDSTESSHFLNRPLYQHRQVNSVGTSYEGGKGYVRGIDPQESFDPYRSDSIWSTGPATDPWMERANVYH